MHKEFSSGAGFALIAALSWGLTGVFVRLSGHHPALEITAGRLLIGLIFILPLLLITRSRINFKLSPTIWILGVLQGLYFLTAVIAFQFAPIAIVALLISTSPVYVLICRATLGEQINGREALGAACAIIGVIIICMTGAHLVTSQVTRPWIGYLFASLAALSTALSAVIIHRQQIKDQSLPLKIAIICLGFGGIIAAIIGLMAGQIGLPLHWSYPEVIAMIALALISTLLATLCYTAASQRLPPLLNVTLMLSTPIFATLFAYIFLGEKLSWSLVPSCALILIGVRIIASAKVSQGLQKQPNEQADHAA
ncbi:DMT family transporter [Aquirhabdus sp.]|uniref:DMT family transporter n=1 Tax=Aquirhabdus sp. TaxID=2824160 RepID=UPI00396CC8E7